MKKKYTLFLLSTLFSLSFQLTSFAGDLEDGIDLYKKGEYEKAISILMKAVKNDPESPEPHLWLSKCYESNLQLDKVIEETKLYNTLKYRKNKKEEIKNKEIKKEVEETPQNQDNPEDLVRINDNFIRDLLDKRVEETNKKYFSIKELKKIISKIPLETEELIKVNREYELLVQYALATEEDIIALFKAKTNLTELKIEDKKLELANESDENNKKLKEDEIKVLTENYKKDLQTFSELVSKPIEKSYLPFSYEEYLAIKALPEEYIQRLEEKKNEFKPAIDKATLEIKTLKTKIISQEKELASKKLTIPDKLLEVKLDDLSDIEKVKVTSYLELKAVIAKDKDDILNYISEQSILLQAFERLNNTIKQVKPDYVIKEVPLPKAEVIFQKPVEKTTTDKK